MSFKLLAIRPLNNCSKKFLKNLERNRIYKLYENYEFFDVDNIRVDDLNSSQVYAEVKKITFNESCKLPNDFFSEKLSISSIIGKNGSGKSSLIELLIATINQLSISLKNDERLNTTEDLISTNEKNNGEIHCEIFYEINENFFCILIQDETFTFTSINTDIEFDLNEFFYTEVINYSLYAFNSWEMGNWVDSLFHKNDSYQIPIVINPKREPKWNGMAGVIDVNNESDLLQQRLLSVILSNPNFEITENLSAKYFKLELKDSKSFFILNKEQIGKEIIKEKEIKEEFYKKLNSDFAINFNKNNDINPSSSYVNLKDALEEFKEYFEINEIEIPEIQYKIDNYILYKIISICQKYISYQGFIEKEGSFSTINIQDFLAKIESNDSHIVYKLKQIVNFIKHYDEIWSHIDMSNLIQIEELGGLLKELSKENKKPLMEYLPPPIFQTSLISSNEINLLDTISSGEKQLVHSISTILYHLVNLNSVEKDEFLVKYRYVNIVLDEVELYFHPEFQKMFLAKFINEIENIELECILGINVIIISHSPFILSDIPKQNVLFLKKGSPVSLESFKNTNTFAANYSELLSDSFFIRDGLIGDFAKQKITKTIKWLNLTREEFLKHGNSDNNFHELSKKRESHKMVIDIIDEPIIKNKLLEMYSEIFGNEEKIKYLNAEKERIENEIAKLTS